MATNPLQPQQPITSGAPTVAAASQISKDNPGLVQHAPDQASVVIATGANPDVAGGLNSINHVTAATQAVKQNQQMYSSGSWWKTVLGDVGKVINAVPGLGTVAQWANKGLQEVQSDYKFLHAVYVDHGFGQGLLATLGVAGGAAVGALAGPEGIALGADAAASLERDAGGQLLPEYQDAYKKSIDPNYKVSIGRDIANGLSNVPGLRTLKDTDHGIGQFISGSTDAAFDLEADPLANAGKVANALKSGKYLDTAKELDASGNPVLNAQGQPKTLLGADGKPIVVATIPLARNAPAVKNFLLSVSNKALTSDQVMQAYEAGGLAGRFNAALNPIKRAFDDIAERTNPIDIQRAYPGTQFTPSMLEQLAAAKSGQEVASIFGKSLYAGETKEDAVSTVNLAIPTRTLGRSLVANLTDTIIKKSGDTPLSQERNLLLPKRVPVLKPDGTQDFAVDEDGNQVVKTKYAWGGLLSKTDGAWNGWGALAGKVRTFTGYKSLVINQKLMQQSGNEFKFTDHGAGTALFNMFYYAMPRDVALEKAAEIMAEPNPITQQELYAAGVKEVIKAAGLPDDYNIVRDTMSHAQRAGTGGNLGDMQSGTDHLGNVLGEVEMKTPTVAGNDRYGTPKDSAPVALWSWQRGSNAFIDFKDLRNAMKQATIHGLMYSPKVDDWYTRYTDKIFAPMTLFTTGFGLRVASSEALHQVIRKGLADYLQTKIAFTGAKYDYSNLSTADREIQKEMLGKTPAERQAILDKVAQAATPEDANAVLGNDVVKSNEITDLEQEKEKQYQGLEKSIANDPDLSKYAKARNLIRPFGWTASKMAPYLASEKYKVLMNWQLKMGGLTVPSGVASDHLAHFNLNQAERAAKTVEELGHGADGKQSIMGLTGKDPHYHVWWAQNLSKVRNEQMARDIANDYLRLSKTPVFRYDLTPDQQWSQIQQLHQARIEDPTKYADLRHDMVGLRDGKASSFSDAQVKAIRGLVTGKDGTIHTDLLNNIANAKVTYAEDLKKIPLLSSPAKVIGKVAGPTYDNAIQRILQMGYRKFINPVMDNISREPMFGHYLYENYRSLQPLVDAEKINDLEALQFAGQKAVVQMVPMIHNPALRSQFAVLTRGILPFYFAQEQAFKRYERLAYSNPQALRDFQMINHGINNPGFVHTDSNGNKYIVYPLVGEFGNALLRGLNAIGIDSTDGLPESITGNVSSLTSVLPEMKMPGLNPLATIPLTALTSRFTWGNKLANFATGGYPDPTMLQTVFPNSAIRDLWDGLQMNDKESSVHNATLSAIAAAYYHGDLPDNYSALPYAQQQKIMDRINNNARSNLFLKGVMSFFLPLSPTVSNDYYNKSLQSLNSEFNNMTLPVSQGGLGLTLPEALAKFTSEHGTRSISYTVSHSQTGEGGADLPLAQSTLDWLNNNKAIQDKYKFGAAYLVPQTASDKNALQVENELLTMQLRSRKTPQQFIDSIYIAKGWADMSDNWNAYQKDVAAARAVNNRTAIYNYTQAWNQVAQQYGTSNPTWYADYTNPSRLDSAANALKDLQDMSKNGDLKGSQATGIKTLLQGYDQYHAELQANTISVAGTIKHTPGYSVAQNDWFTYLTELEADPNTTYLTNVINGVFKRVK